MMKLHSKSILVLLSLIIVCFSSKIKSQIVNSDTLTEETFKDHISLIVSNKFIFKRLIHINENNDSVIYFNLSSIGKFEQPPYKIENIKIYLWSNESYFFYAVKLDHFFRIIDISHCWAWTSYEFMIYSKKTYYGNLKISNIRNQKKVPAYIEELKVYKLNKIKKN